MNRDGELLIDAAVPRTGAQPPCLLRYSPQRFAKQCPEMFAYDEHTNTLSLQPGRRPPWIRKSSEEDGAHARAKSWAYCPECKARWCPDGVARSKAFPPFRDRASQLNMKADRPCCHAPQSGAAASQSTQPEPEPEDEGGCADAFVGDVDIPQEEGDEEDEPILLPTQGLLPDAAGPNIYPTLAEYRARWSARFAAHSGHADGVHTLTNLVPRPVPNLWQDCPMAPFEQLRSEEAQANLSVCKPVSAFTPSTMREGVPR
jgi:hypothetical protein